MRRMPKGWIVPLVGLVWFVSLVACAPEEEDDPAALAPTAISPDERGTCKGAGNCGTAGALRWSLPLEGRYFLKDYGDDGPIVLPEWMPYGNEFPPPEAVAHDGTLYYYEQERFRAVDTETGELLWTEEIDPDRPKAVDGVQAVGDTLVVYAQATRTEEGLLYLVDPEKDSPRWQRVDVPLWSAASGNGPAKDTRLLLESELAGPRAGELDRYFLLDVATGEVEWDADLPERPDRDSLTGNVVYVEKSPRKDEKGSARIFRIDMADGRELSDFLVPGEPREGERVHATETGELVLGSSSCGKQGDGCDADPVRALDAETGELLWEYHENAAILSLVERGATTLVYIQDKDGYRSVDAHTGAVVDEDVSGDTENLIDQFGASDSWWRRERGPDDDLRMAPAKPFGPGVGEFSVKFAAGTRYLTSYVTAEGEAVGVYLGCAPDGMRSRRMDAPAPGQECVSPRLFTVDYGV
ncbi:PQQ-binding-like beta-propeller repeat protein [Nocardiopsis rhodophaea]